MFAQHFYFFDKFKINLKILNLRQLEFIILKMRVSIYQIINQSIIILN